MKNNTLLFFSNFMRILLFWQINGQENGKIIRMVIMKKKLKDYFEELLLAVIFFDLLFLLLFSSKLPCTLSVKVFPKQLPFYRILWCYVKHTSLLSVAGSGSMTLTTDHILYGLLTVLPCLHSVIVIIMKKYWVVIVSLWMFDYMCTHFNSQRLKVKYFRWFRWGML